MNILGRIGDLLGSVLGVVDDVHTSEEEKLALKGQLLQTHAQILATVVEAEQELMRAQSSIIKAEAESKHWLTSTWRPITMLTFLVLIVIAQFGGTPVPDQMWPLLKLGIGGYVIGRSFEKSLPSVMSALKTEEKT